MTVLLTIGIFLYCIDKKNITSKIAAFILGCTIIYQFLLIAFTYSRGGWLALLAGLSFILIFYQKKRMVFCMLFFLAIIIFNSNGVDRVRSIGATNEGSIHNRLLLWSGGSGIIANNPVSGLDSIKSAGDMYTAWYQPLWLKETYIGLISDYLNIAVHYGIFALFLYFSIIFLTIFFGIKLWLEKRNMILLGVLGAIVAYLCSAVFSTFYLFFDVYWLFLALLFIAIVYVVWAFYTKTIKIRWVECSIPLSCSLLICILLLSYGTFVNYKLPYSYSYNLYQNKGKNVQFYEACLKKNPKAIIIYLFDSQRKNIKDEARLTIRPLLAMNYKIIAAGVDTGFEGQKKAISLLKKIMSNKTNIPVLLMGQGDGAKQAIIAASHSRLSKLSMLIALGTPATWPFEELSPELHIKNITIPLLLIHGQNDSLYSYTDSQALKKICDENKLVATLKIIPGAESYFGAKRTNIIKLVDTFITQNISSQ
jgi:dienelactone hydrolase